MGGRGEVLDKVLYLFPSAYSALGSAPCLRRNWNACMGSRLQGMGMVYLSPMQVLNSNQTHHFSGGPFSIINNRSSASPPDMTNPLSTNLCEAQGICTYIIVDP